jgi:hypothetical protein
MCVSKPVRYSVYTVRVPRRRQTNQMSSLTLSRLNAVCVLCNHFAQMQQGLFA